MIKCTKHPWYRGIYRHRTNCGDCDLIYFDNHGQTETPTPTFRTHKHDDGVPWKTYGLLIGLGFAILIIGDLLT